MKRKLNASRRLAPEPNLPQTPLRFRRVAAQSVLRGTRQTRVRPMPKLLQAPEGHGASFTEIVLAPASQAPAAHGRLPRLPQFHGCRIDAAAALLTLKIMLVG